MEALLARVSGRPCDSDEWRRGMRGIVCLLVTLIAMPALAAGSTPQAAAAGEKAAKPPEAAKAGVTLVEVVPDLPDYPNAVMASSKERGPGDGWTHSFERETRTTASFADIRTFYLEQFGKKGWKVTATREKPGKSEWVLSKGASWGRVTLDGGSAGMVKITVEWKSR
jgi:hypothetical protein